jgi:predicted DNA-binding protein
MATVKKLITLDEGIARELEVVAKSLGTTQKEIVERALDYYFDFTDAIVADKILEEIESGKEETIPWDEAKRLLDLED